MVNFKHKELAEGGWQKLTLAEQLGNIGSEVLRASRAYGKDEKLFWGAVERALELFDLTLSDPRWVGRRREIARAREVFCDAVYGGKLYKSTFPDLIKYFDQFAYAARLGVVTRHHTARSGFSNVVAVVIALVVLAGAGVGYLAVRKKTPSTGPLQLADETAGWKAFRNNWYRFELKYPPDWHVLSDGDWEATFYKEDTVIELEVGLNKPPDQDFLSFVKKLAAAPSGKYGPSGAVSEVNFGNVSLVRVEKGRGGEVPSGPGYFLESPFNSYFRIIVSEGTPEAIVGKIISTFKFLEESEIVTSPSKTLVTEGWKTYKSGQYGFEIKYPPDWEIASEKSIIDDVNKIHLLVYVSDRDKKYTFYVSVDEKTPSLISEAPVRERVMIAGSIQVAYIFPKGYECIGAKPGDDCSFFRLPIKHSDYWYTLGGIQNATTVSGIYGDIFSTFKFIQ